MQKRIKKEKYCALFAVLEEEKGILYISIRPYLAGPQGENYIYYLENGSTVGEKCPGAKPQPLNPYPPYGIIPTQNDCKNSEGILTKFGVQRQTYGIIPTQDDRQNPE